VVNATPRPLYSRIRAPVPIVQKAGLRGSTAFVDSLETRKLSLSEVRNSALAARSLVASPTALNRLTLPFYRLNSILCPYVYLSTVP
jgi:hypothetical protein